MLFSHHASNIILSMPFLTVLIFDVVSFPLYVPLVLLVPHLVYLTLISLSILMDLKLILKKTDKPFAGI